MKPLPEKKCALWGKEFDVVPYLIEAIHGDGKQWLWLGYLDDRPWFYVVRVDSSVMANNGNSEWGEEVLPWIQNQIEEEMVYFMTDEENDEWIEKGYLEDGGTWPIPPLGGSCGCEWGEYAPNPEDL